MNARLNTAGRGRLRVAAALLAVATLAGCGGVDAAVQEVGAAGATPQPGVDGAPGADGGPGAAGGKGGDGGNARSVGFADAEVEAPAGMRYVGYGRAAVAVPESWGTNEVHCGKPARDTVLVDPGAVRDCGAPRPAGVESVWVGPFRNKAPREPSEPIQVDGVAAWRDRVLCLEDSFGGAKTCSGLLRIPSEGVAFAVASSTGRAEIEEIFARVRILEDRVAVPGFRNSYPRLDEDAYAERLREMGLASDVRTEFALQRDAGEILGVSPGPGTVLRPGDVVTVRVAEGPRSAADEV